MREKTYTHNSSSKLVNSEVDTRVQTWVQTNVGLVHRFLNGITTGMKTGGSKDPTSPVWAEAIQPSLFTSTSLEGTWGHTALHQFYTSLNTSYIPVPYSSRTKASLTQYKGLNQTGMKVASTSMGPGMKEGGEKNKEKSLIPGPSW
jgi:hypothetical protein